jgi:lipopolysaccharide transport system ATP-binding protein
MSHIIEIKKLSKKYTLCHENQGGYSTLVETMTNKARHIFAKLRSGNKSNQASPTAEDFWALQDINLNISEGDRVGIIGRNGSGKSTLLKILSRITEPTSGTVKIRGRVSSLLEVGTGFHPELTGRENIFLNGAILGMKRQEIKSKFDEIVAFSEIEKFLDLPVKRYSSGMYMRLGFSIAAHLDSDLLVVDEVLAVGDSKFQEKCLKKLNSLSSSGRTILFVSHDIGSIIGLCNKGILLEKGQLKVVGTVDETISHYMQSIKEQGLTWSGNAGDEHIRFLSASLAGNDIKEFFYQDEMVRIEIDYEVLKPTKDLVLGIGIWNQRNQLLAQSYTDDDHEKQESITQPGRKKALFSINSAQFYSGNYSIKPVCYIHNVKRMLDDEISLKFIVYAKKTNPYIHLDRSGISLGYPWQITNCDMQ